MTRLPTIAIIGIALTLILGNTAVTAAQPDSGITMAEGKTLTAADCAVEPRTREEMLEVLSVIPEQNTSPASRPAPVTKELYEQVQADFFQWQACFAFHLTWQWAALETPYRLGQRMYSFDSYSMDPGIFNDTPQSGLLSTPFSDSTLNEILDSWEATDAALRADQEAKGFSKFSETYVIDPGTSTFRNTPMGPRALT